MGQSGETFFNNDAANNVSTTATQTLTNKSFDDSTCKFVDTADSTKQIKFNAAGTTSTSTTITSSQTTNKIWTLPDATDTAVGKATADVFTNKSLSDSTCAIVDVSDNTKQILFNAVGTTGTSTTLTSSQTANRVVTFPDASITVNFGVALYVGTFTGGSGSNFFTVTNTAYTNFTETGTMTLTQEYNSAFGSVTKSSGAGITFTAPFTGTIEIEAAFCSGLTVSANGGIALTDGANTIINELSFRNNATNDGINGVVKGFFDVTATTVYVFKVRGKTTAGAVSFGGSASVDALISFIMKYVK